MLLFLDMRDMMGMILQSVLVLSLTITKTSRKTDRLTCLPFIYFRVSDISDQEMASRRDDPRLGDHIQDLMKSIGDDITHAYNVCEAYHNKSLISKAWHAESWIGKLAKCSQHFRKQREALAMALTAHSAHGVDETVRRLRALEDRFVSNGSTRTSDSDCFIPKTRRLFHASSPQSSCRWRSRNQPPH